MLTGETNSESSPDVKVGNEESPISFLPKGWYANSCGSGWASDVRDMRDS